VLQIEIWNMFTAIKARGLQAGRDSRQAAPEAAAAAAARQCQPLQKRSDRIEWPVGKRRDLDDLGYVVPDTPDVV
jgi:hypothetical protein